MKKLVAFLLAVLLVFACCGCGKKAKEPVVYETYETAHLEPFDLRLQLARGYYHTPETDAGKTVLTMMVNMTYLGKEGVAFALGKTEEQPYVRFMIHYGDGYVFEEYKLTGNRGQWEATSKAVYMRSGDVDTTMDCLRFEPMENAHEIQLWMIVPQVVLDNRNDELYLAVEVNGETILYDISGEIDWERLIYE